MCPSIATDLRWCGIFAKVYRIPLALILNGSKRLWANLPTKNLHIVRKVRNPDMQNQATLDVLVGEISDRLRKPGPIDAELQSQLSALQQTLQARILDAASQPIETWEQLKDRLLQIKHSYKHGLFDLR